PTPLEERTKVETAEAWGQDFGGDAPSPFVEVAKNNFGPPAPLLSQNGGQSLGLILTFPQAGAQMDVVHMQSVSLDFQVGPLAAAPSTIFPGQVMLSVIDNRKSTEDHVAEGGAAPKPGLSHHPSHA